jgi:hypothetical protein
MTDEEQRKYHHNANEGETRAPSEEADPHHALNTPVGALDESVEAMLDTEDDEGERLERADDRSEEERASEERSRNG